LGDGTEDEGVEETGTLDEVPSVVDQTNQPEVWDSHFAVHAAAHSEPAVEIEFIELPPEARFENKDAQLPQSPSHRPHYNTPARIATPVEGEPIPQAQSSALDAGPPSQIFNERGGNGNKPPLELDGNEELGSCDRFAQWVMQQEKKGVMNGA